MISAFLNPMAGSKPSSYLTSQQRLTRLTPSLFFSSFIFQGAHTPSCLSTLLVFLLKFLSMVLPQPNLALDLLSTLTPLVIICSLMVLHTVSVFLQLTFPAQTPLPNSRLVFSVAYLTLLLGQLPLPFLQTAPSQLLATCVLNCSHKKLLNQPIFLLFIQSFRKILLVLFKLDSESDYYYLPPPVLPPWSKPSPSHAWNMAAVFSLTSLVLTCLPLSI